LIKEVNTEQAKKLDNILGFVEQSGSLSVENGRNGQQKRTYGRP
jgi:hypothetical protein